MWTLGVHFVCVLECNAWRQQLSGGNAGWSFSCCVCSGSQPIVWCEYECLL